MSAIGHAHDASCACIALMMDLLDIQMQQTDGQQVTPEQVTHLVRRARMVSAHIAMAEFDLRCVPQRAPVVPLRSVRSEAA